MVGVITKSELRKVPEQTHSEKAREFVAQLPSFTRSETTKSPSVRTETTRPLSERTKHQSPKPKPFKISPSSMQRVRAELKAEREAKAAQPSAIAQQLDPHAHAESLMKEFGIEEY